MQVLGRSRGGEGVLILDVFAITANHSGSAALFLSVSLGESRSVLAHGPDSPHANSE